MKNVDSLKIASKFLKSEREKRGITLEEVSFELKLEKNLILDIKNRNFKKFKSYLFLRGYLINYAEFLNVDINLPDTKKKKEIKTKHKSKKGSFNKNLNKKKQKIIFSSIILFVFVIITLSLNSKVLFNSDSKINDISLLKPQENKSIISNNDPQNSIGNENIEKKVSEIQISKNSENILENTNIIDLKKPINTIESNNSVINKDNISRDIITTDKILVISYSGDSWTEIIDANGDIVFFDLVKKNDVLKLVVKAPFEILLGDATVANIKYNNKNIIIPYINPENNVSKIIIDN